MKNNNNILNDIVRKIQNNEISCLKELLEYLLNTFMISERTIFLQNSENNKANGFYPRALSTGGLTFNLNVPRDRKGLFRPAILPNGKQRTVTDYEDFISSLLINGYSKNQIKYTLKEMGAPYSEEEIEGILEKFNEELAEFRRRELAPDWLALFVDAFECEMRTDKGIKKVQVYIVLGIDLDGTKDLLGFYIGYGRENKAFWMEVMRDLVERGVRRPLLIVSDDFPGLEDAISQVFPLTDHQLCFVHLQRNIRRNMRRDDAGEFIKGLNRVKTSSTYEMGIQEFNSLCDRFSDKYPGYMRFLRDRMEKYLAFLKYPEDIRKYIYTTNSVESFNRLLEDMRQAKRGIFQSERVLGINTILLYRRLKTGRWKKPIPHIASKQYEIHQLFAITFKMEDNLNA